MSGVEVTFDTTGIEKMVKALDKMAVDIEPAVNKAAQAGLKPVKRAIKAQTPVATDGGGTLKRAVGQKKEKTKSPGKRVYEVRVSPKYNDKLQREIKRPGIYGGKSTKAYYPASQEYGFLVRKKNGTGVEYRYGRKFYRYSAIPDKGVEGRDDVAEWFTKYAPDMTRSIMPTNRKSRHGLWRIYIETVHGTESRKVEGRHFMRKGAEQAEPQARAVMIDTLEKELDKLCQEAQHG